MYLILNLYYFMEVYGTDFNYKYTLMRCFTSNIASCLPLPPLMLLRIVALTFLLCTISTRLSATTLPPPPLACITCCCLLLLLLHRHSILNFSCTTAVVIIITSVAIWIVDRVCCQCVGVESVGARMEGTCRGGRMGRGLHGERGERRGEG